MTQTEWTEWGFQASLCHTSLGTGKSLKQILRASQRGKTAGPPGDLHRCLQADSAGWIWENKSLGKLSSPLQPVNDYVFTCPWGKRLYCGLSEEFPLSSGGSGSEVKLKTPNSLSMLHHLTDFRLNWCSVSSAVIAENCLFHSFLFFQTNATTIFSALLQSLRQCPLGQNHLTEGHANACY